MKAWQFDRVGEPLALRDVEVPTPERDEVQIRVKAAGLCHTDAGILYEPYWSARIGPFPLTLGHELAGVITEVGADVTDYRVGDRVGVFPGGRTRPGLGRGGGFQGVVTAYPEDLVRIPDSLSFVFAATGTDAGRAAYRGLAVGGGPNPGQKIGIIGFGGLGRLAAHMAVIAGSEVYVADPKESARAEAQALGVAGVAADIREFADVGLQLISDYAGFGVTTAGAIEVIEDHGTIVQVGMGRDTAEISTAKLVFKQIRLIGSKGGTVQDIAHVYDLMANDGLDPKAIEISFDEIPQALDRLYEGAVEGRLVVVYPDDDCEQE